MDKFGHFKKWCRHLPSIPNSQKQITSPVDFHYLRFYMCRKLQTGTSTRTQWAAGLWVVPSFMSSWEERWQELQVIAQTIMFSCLTKLFFFFSSFSHLLLFHFYLLRVNSHSLSPQVSPPQYQSCAVYRMNHQQRETRGSVQCLVWQEWHSG